MAVFKQDVLPPGSKVLCRRYYKPTELQAGYFYYDYGRIVRWEDEPPDGVRALVRIGKHDRYILDKDVLFPSIDLFPDAKEQPSLEIMELRMRCLEAALKLSDIRTVENLAERFFKYVRTGEPWCGP